MIDWNAVTKEDSMIIRQIAERAVALAKDCGVTLDFMSTEMDVEATHVSGCPLKLERLLAADDANFAHDVFGIVRYIDRETGELGGYFLPRFAQPQPSTAR